MFLPPLALLLAATVAIAHAQPSTMTVVLKDGSRHPFRLADVARVEMGDASVAAPTVTPPRTSSFFHGDWDVKSSTGWTARFTIRANGATATANYSTPNGRITAQLLGAEYKSLSGYWYQSESGQRCGVAREGTFYWGVIKLSHSTDNEFQGTWDYCAQGRGGQYTGVRVR